MCRHDFSWLSWFLLLLVLAFIWGQSLQPGAISHGESRRVLEMIRQFLGSNILTEWLTDNRIRRLAHLTEYGALGLVASLEEMGQRVQKVGTGAWSARCVPGRDDSVLRRRPHGYLA